MGTPKREQATFLLEGLSPADVERLEANGGTLESHGRRGIYLSDTPPGVPKEMIVRSLPGDQVSFLRPWLKQNIIDVLHDEYLKLAPVSVTRQKKALAGWVKAKQRRADVEQALRDESVAWKRRREELEEAIEASKRAEFTASEEVLRTHGRGPVEIGGVTWDPGQNSGNCYFVPRRTKKEEADES